ncbi:MAG: DUF1559 domain-containing protein [Pirellulales bacterium]|nr:DUF1559 domain-containing protein [Pirellulales bacterium]
MKTPKFLRPNGFTLVELLVVIAIIGILIAMLLPAVQAAREAARRMQCCNNFKQAAVALHNYESSNKSFPVGWRHAEYECGLNFFFEGFGWGAYLLPYAEQNDIYDNLLHNGTWPARYKDPTNGHLNAGGATIDTFLCPSDPQTEPRVEVTNLFDNGDPAAGGKDDHGRSNMAGAASSIDYTCSTRLGITSRRPDPQADGVLRGWAPVKIRDISDGTSNTVLIGEVTGAGPGTWSGFKWTSGAVVDASGGINGLGTIPGGGTWAGNDSGFSSYHSGGCHFAMADGSSRFVSEDIEQATLERIVARNDGEMPGEF